MSTSVTSAVVGALACQRDSYLKSFATKVVSCRPVEVKTSSKDKKKKDAAAAPATPTFEVELEDTILFPEGGGQPSDMGFLVAKSESEKKVPVEFVKREGLKAVHLVSEPVEVGQKVELELNWERRFDHMQQHTGQHLLSAIMDKYELPTLSWNMGDLINYIEIPRKISEEEKETISKEVNQRIAEAIPITVEVPDKENVKKDKMPGNYDLEKGVLRVVHIGHLDSNPCCGTHLETTSQIKGIVLLNQFSGKGSNSRLNFVAGDRIFRYLESAHSILKNLGGALSCQPEQLGEKVSLLSIQAKKSQSREQAFLKEIAGYKAQELKKELETKKIVSFHRADVGLEFIMQIFKELSPLEAGTVVLMTGEGKEGGAVLVFGEAVEEIVGELKKVLSGLKGGGKGKFQGKVSAYNKGELESAKLYLESL